MSIAHLSFATGWTLTFAYLIVCPYEAVAIGELVAFVAPEIDTLELYRVVPGELCLVSSACLFRSTPLSAQGITTKPTSLLLIPPPTFTQWLTTSTFRDDVLGLFAERMADLTGLIDAVAFHKLDQRLAAALLGRGQDLALTHQTLADELGTVREMVTRLLRRFEREGWVELAREHITIRNSAALRDLASALTV